MKSAAQDGKLKASDLVRADRIPGFETNLLSTTVRITRSGWASCRASTWQAEDGEIGREMEHRFSEDDLRQLNKFLDAAARIELEPVTWDDIPILKLTFPVSSGIKSLETMDWPSAKTDSLQQEAFDKLWNIVHQPFRDFINFRTKRCERE